MGKLTNTKIKSALPQSKKYILPDGDKLSLVVSISASKSWQVRYKRPFLNTTGKISLGKYPEVTLKEARAKRDSINELLAKNIDPKAHRSDLIKQQQEININTLEKVANDWLLVRKSEVADSTWRTTSSILERYVFQSIGKYPIKDLTAPIVIDALKKIEARGIIETLNKTIGILNQIMTFATNTGLIHHNPLSGIKSAFSKRKTENNPHFPPEQLPELLHIITDSDCHKITRYYLYWKLHTMTRTQESSRAEWSEINFEEKIWVIPQERMKTRVKHIIPLTEQMFEILDKIKVYSQNNNYIFPAVRTYKGHINDDTGGKALRTMGLQGKQTAHGFRGLARTALSDNGFSFEASEACLSHKVGNVVSQSYNHSTYFDQRVIIMKWWSEQIEQAMIGLPMVYNNITQIKAVG